MTDIGATLREARMHARIDISEVEAATKIRAKYLRALENEEWDLIPGPTFVKSFLRTYAEYLGLDARLLVEEYKQRHERLSDQELRPIAPLGSEQKPRRNPVRWISPGVVAGAIVVALLVILFVIGSLGGSGGTTTSTPSAAERARQLAQQRAQRREHALALERAHRAALERERVRLEVIPASDVYVCLVDNNGKKLIPGRTLSAGSHQTFTAKSFRIGLGNNQETLKINGASFQPPASGAGVSYLVKPGQSHPTVLSGSQAPQCP